MTDTKPEPREAHIVHNDYQPSKAQLEADARVEATFEEAVAGSRNARGSQESGTVTKFRLRPDPCTGRFSPVRVLNISLCWAGFHEHNQPGRIKCLAKPKNAAQSPPEF